MRREAEEDWGPLGLDRGVGWNRLEMCCCPPLCMERIKSAGPAAGSLGGHFGASFFVHPTLVSSATNSVLPKGQFRDSDHGHPRLVLSEGVSLGGQISENCVMVRYVAFLVLGSAFVTGIVTMVQTHRLSAEPKVLFTSTPVNYVDGHWPSSLPAMLRGPVSH